MKRITEKRKVEVETDAVITQITISFERETSEGNNGVSSVIVKIFDKSKGGQAFQYLPGNPVHELFKGQNWKKLVADYAALAFPNAAILDIPDKEKKEKK